MSRPRDGEPVSITGSRPARGTAVAALIAFLGVLVFYIDRPGYTRARLVLFVALGTAATLGTGGAALGRPWVAGVAAAVLGVLGLPQPVLWVFVLPMAGVLAAAAFLIALDERTVEER